MYNQRTSVRRTRGKFTRSTRSNHSKRGASSSRFSGKKNWSTVGRGRPKNPKLDISSFINKAVAPSVPKKTFVPEHSFADFNLMPELQNSVAARGYAQPTPIQDKIIPSILEGRDVVGLANTGTGKTGAFLIPIVNNVLQNIDEQILIVVPTRELALQIEQELQSITKRMRVYSTVCVGGEYIGRQIAKLQHKGNFIIGTPGRLLDLLERGNLLLGETHTVVLDEADRMLDMGFIKDIRRLMDHVPADRQTLCFSATMSKTIELLINDLLKNPHTVSVRTETAPTNIEQGIVHVRDLNKIDTLYDLLQNSEFKKVLVFGRTKRGVEKVARTMTKRGIKTESIHSDKSLSQRKRALANFKEGRVRVLMATDVAARGLHIDNVSHVINYDIPETYDDYIHRIGRTGRADASGKALTFID